MVKNESKILARMLDSCLGIATHFAVVDTGSTDKTRELAKMWGTQHKVPLCLFKTTFQDFGSTRTYTISCAKRMAKDLHLKLDETYLLLLDGDMTLSIQPGFTIDQLTEKYYLLEQINGNQRYWNGRIIRADVECRYLCRTHEYLDVTDCLAVKLDSLKIQDVNDGGCKADKIDRDIRLLEADLKDQVCPVRTLYYLGTSYEAAGRRQDAIDTYTERIGLAGWDEEQWMAMYRRGIVYKDMGKIAEAERDFVDCWRCRPQRAEPLWQLVNMAQTAGAHEKVCLLSIAAMNIPLPAETLFVEESVYKWAFKSALVISSFYAGDKYDGGRWCDYLQMTKESPHKGLALQNMPWYCQQLPCQSQRDLQALAGLKEAMSPSYHACNPSLLRVEDTLHCVVRGVNYKIRPDGSYDYPGVVHTQNWYVQFDKNMKLKRPPVMLQNVAPEPNSAIQGFEDIRIGSVDSFSVTGLAVRVDDDRHCPTIYRVVWGNTTGSVWNCQKLSSSSHPEKNWLPFDNGQKILYGMSPMKILSETGATIFTQEVGLDLTDLRGGAPPIRFDGGWLWVVHQFSIIAGQTKRVYLHRFCFTDSTMKGPLRISRPFFFRNRNIEFCAGLAQGFDDNLLLSFGFNDNEAWLAEVTPDTIRKMLSN
jgi:tetratricopeptide (TPR) repeat protein